MASLLQQSKLIFLCAIVTTLPAVTSQAANPPGVTDTSIRIGSCSALSGPASFLGIQTQVGALAYFHLVNSQGGVYGRTIELKSRDDGYNPEQAAGCFKSLTGDNIFAMGFLVGTPTAAKYVPMADAEKIPVVGLFTGAQMLMSRSTMKSSTSAHRTSTKHASRLITYGKSAESARSE